MANLDTSTTISEYIENQFPDVYKDNGPVLVAFIKAYYEFLESQSDSSTPLTRQILDNIDIDDTLDQFVKNFKETYLKDFPFITASDKRFIIKHIFDLYRSKGSELSLELLIRMLFNVETSVYYPAKDILRADDSTWFEPEYIECTLSPHTPRFIETQIVGTLSGATAFVEGVVRKRVNSTVRDVMYITQRSGTFQTGELIYCGFAVFEDLPKVVGSLSSLTITNGGRNNAVGDLFNIVHESGRQGVARVTSVEDYTGRVDFDLVDGGSGYTLNTPNDGNTSNDYTDVRVATAMIGVDNSNTDNQYIFLENVYQNREQLNLLSATGWNSEYFANTEAVAGDYATGVKTYVETTVANGTATVFPRHSQSTNNLVVTVDDVLESDSNYSSNDTHVTFTSPPAAAASVKAIDYVEVANGLIVSVANTDNANNTISDPSANSRTVVVLSSGTFANQVAIDFTSDAPYAVGETVLEEQDITLQISDVNGSFSVSETVSMTTYQPASNVGNTILINQYAYGTVTAANSTHVVLSPAFGTFIDGERIIGQTSAANAEITTVTIDTAGATGVATTQDDANTWTIQDITGAFTAGKEVIGVRSRIVREISAVSDTGASDVWYNANVAANGVVDTVANTTVSGVVVGQNTTFVGLYGNTTDFSYVEGAGLAITTNRINIKEHDLTDRPDLNHTINSLATGDNATFQPGSLENEETVTLNTDLIGANNVANTPFLDVRISGANSGVGFVDSITINDGGTLYSNGSVVTFTGGGYGDGDPLVQANGSITTDGSGTITSITINTIGEGYYTTPTIVLPATGGTEANTTVNMDFGYGFIKNPNGDATTEFQNLWTYDNFTMGTIASLTSVNPGSDYNTDPFVSVHNKYIGSFNRRGLDLDISIISGSFQIGEIVEQSNVSLGIVISANTSTLQLKRLSFNTSLTTGSITGATSGTTATVNSIRSLGGSLAMGNNAVVTANVIVANGVATGLEIIDSGYGYIDGVEATLSAANNNFVMTANTVVTQQGIGQGYWTTYSSHIDQTARLQDDEYYQEFSYDVQTGVSLDKYRDIVKDVLHVAGTRMFGTVVRTNTVNVATSVVTTNASTITVE